MLHSVADSVLIPIGTSPAWYNPGEAGSGYLLESGTHRVLVDCGPGVLSSYLSRFSDQQPIHSVVISHAHADHVMDLVPFVYGMRLGTLQGWSRPDLWLAPGVHDRLKTMISAWDTPSDFFESAFNVRTFAPGETHQIGRCQMTSIEVPHYIESYALRFDAPDGSFGYSGDLGPCDHIAGFMSGVDLFLCEATDPVGAHQSGASALRGHLTPTEAGEIANSAGVHSLLLSHVPAENGAAKVLASARTTFSGPVALAKSGTPYLVAARLAQPV